MATSALTIGHAQGPSRSLRRILATSRRLRAKLPGRSNFFGHSYDRARVRGQAASDLIAQRLRDDRPLLVARFGQNELACVLNYRSIVERAGVLSKSLSYIAGQRVPFWWDHDLQRSMEVNAGFFPATGPALADFSELMLRDTREIDVLGSWLREEAFLDDLMPDAVRVALPDLEPYYHDDPWTAALEGKKVLVVHPYDTTIARQYANRDRLFADRRMLPAFELKTIKAVQSIAGTPTAHATWFDALRFMERQIEATEYDVAIIGCGAYGLPLAAAVKRMGKKAVHLGGATQILFGIRGKRWDEIPFFQALMNEHWVRPSQDDVPRDHGRVENGCYW